MSGNFQSIVLQAISMVILTPLLDLKPSVCAAANLITCTLAMESVENGDGDMMGGFHLMLAAPQGVEPWLTD
jgi:hypothetical protein